MSNSELVKKVSELYRKERNVENELRSDMADLQKRLDKAAKDHWEKISVAEYNSLQVTMDMLKEELAYQGRYCDGIAAARDLLMESIAANLL